MPSKLKKAIGAVKDQTSISLAKVASNNSSNLEVAVLKATTHDDVVPVDNRYVNEILYLVSADKAYAAACTRAIGKRVGRTRNWIVTLKSLLLVLRIFQGGDPYFPREVLHAMKRGAKILNLSSFRDDSNSSPWDFTAFVRTFALYLDERLDCFLTGKLQRRFTRRLSAAPDNSSQRARRADEAVRDMKPGMLLDRIGHWQRLLDRAIATRPTGAAQSNRLVQIALYAVVEESFDLYKDISDGLALILDNFFHLEHQSGVIAFQTCMKAAKQYEELSEFYEVCKSIGVGRTSEYPSIQKISDELIETLQEFLKDHSTFPMHAKSPNNHPSFLLPTPTTPRRARNNSVDGQSEFWATNNTGSQSRRQSSIGGLSDISVATDCSSESGSELGRTLSTSLEDLLSATLTTGGKRRTISIDLEAYPNRDENNFNKFSESGSAKSLPASNSFADLLSLDDWNDDEEENLEGEEAVAEEANNLSEEATTSKDVKQNNDVSSGWELVLFETPPQEAGQAESALPSAVPNVDSGAGVVSSSDFDLDGLLGQVSTPPLQSSGGFPLDLLYNQNPVGPPPQAAAAVSPHHYNPFLQEDFPGARSAFETSSLNQEDFPTTGAGFAYGTPLLNQENFPAATSAQLPARPFQVPPETFFSAPMFQAMPNQPPIQNEFWSAPTFQATPVTQTHEFSSPAPTFQSLPSTEIVQFSSPAATQKETDPFASLFNDQMLGGSKAASGQNVAQEQQVWLQNQNKIISKHMSSSS